MQTKPKNFQLYIVIFTLLYIGSVIGEKDLYIQAGMIKPDYPSLNPLCQESTLSKPLHSLSFLFIQGFFHHALKKNDVSAYAVELENSKAKVMTVLESYKEMITAKIETYPIIPSYLAGEKAYRTKTEMQILTEDFVWKLSRDRIIIKIIDEIDTIYQQIYTSQEQFWEDIKKTDQFKSFSGISISVYPVINIKQIDKKLAYKFTDYIYWAGQIQEMEDLTDLDFFEDYIKFKEESGKGLQEIQFQLCELHKMMLFKFANFIVTGFDERSKEEMKTMIERFENDEILKICNNPDHFTFFVKTVLGLDIENDLKDYVKDQNLFYNFYLTPRKGFYTEEDVTTFSEYAFKDAENDYDELISFDEQIINLFKNKKDIKTTLEVIENYQAFYFKFKESGNENQQIKLNLWFIRLIINSYNKKIAKATNINDKDDILEMHKVLYFIFCEIRLYYPNLYETMYNSEKDMLLAIISFFEMIGKLDNEVEEDKEFLDDFNKRMNKEWIFKYTLGILELIYTELNILDKSYQIEIEITKIVKELKFKSKLDLNLIQTQSIRTKIQAITSSITDDSFKDVPTLKVLVTNGRLIDILIYVFGHHQFKEQDNQIIFEQRKNFKILIQLFKLYEQDIVKGDQNAQKLFLTLANFLTIKLRQEVQMEEDHILQFLYFLNQYQLEGHVFFPSIKTISSFFREKKQTPTFDDKSGKFNLRLLMLSSLVFPHMLASEYKKNTIKIDKIRPYISKKDRDAGAIVKKKFPQYNKDFFEQEEEETQFNEEVNKISLQYKCPKYDLEKVLQENLTEDGEYLACIKHRDEFFQRMLIDNNKELKDQMTTNQFIKEAILSTKFLEDFEANLYMIKGVRIFSDFINQDKFESGKDIQSQFFQLFRIMIQFSSEENFQIQDQDIWTSTINHFHRCMNLQLTTKYTDDLIKSDPFCPYSFQIYNNIYWLVLLGQAQETGDATFMFSEFNNSKFGQIKGRYDYVLGFVFNTSGNEKEINRGSQISKKKLTFLVEPSQKKELISKMCDGAENNFNIDSNYFCNVFNGLQRILTILDSEETETSFLEIQNELKNQNKSTAVMFWMYIFEFLGTILKFRGENEKMQKIYDDVLLEQREFNVKLFKDSNTNIDFDEKQPNALALAVNYAYAKFSHQQQFPDYLQLQVGIHDYLFTGKDFKKNLYEFITLESGYRSSQIKIQHDLAVGVAFYFAATENEYAELIKLLKNKMFFIIEANMDVPYLIIRNFFEEYKYLNQMYAKSENLRFSNIVKNLIDWIGDQEEDIKDQAFLAENMDTSKSTKTAKLVFEEQFNTEPITDKPKNPLIKLGQVRKSKQSAQTTNFQNKEQIQRVQTSEVFSNILQNEISQRTSIIKSIKKESDSNLQDMKEVDINNFKNKLLEESQTKMNSGVYKERKSIYQVKIVKIQNDKKEVLQNYFTSDPNDLYLKKFNIEKKSKFKVI